jgi:hypothetical protein
MSQKSQKKWKSRVVVLFLLAYLISPVQLSQANTAQTLTICVSLKTGVQIISKSGNCNERLYEKVTWFQNGNSPLGTPGSKLISMTTCRSKSMENTQVIKKSCNRATQTSMKWQRPLGPPDAPSIVSITPGKLGAADILINAPENNGGARITSYSVLQYNNEVTSTKSSEGRKFLGTSAVSYPLKSRERIPVGGLTPGQSYRFAVVASNVAGTSQLSESSKEYLVPTIPNSPTITSVVASGPGSVLISFVVTETEFTAPITSFTITANPGGLQSTVTSPLLRSQTFNGLAPLTSYTFTMTANSEAGTSSPAEQSLSVRTFAPQPPPEPVQASSAPSAAAPSAAAPSAAAPSAAAPSAAAPIAAPVIALSSTSETTTAGVALTGYTIASTGGAVASYSISPSAPTGLTFDTTTGLLSGTPTVVASSTIYTITGTNATGSAAATFTLTVTDPIAISAPAIAGVTAPVKDATPVSTTTAGTGYTGVVSWSGSPTTFEVATTYTATITLTAASGYTLTGVSANFFSVAGATTVTHAADSGVITAVFPATAKATQTVTFTDPSDITFGTSPSSLSGTSTSTLTVAFTTATSGVCTVSGTTLTILTAGTCTINANQVGDANYAAASQVVQSFTIAKAAQTITFDTPSAMTLGGFTQTVAPTTSSSLTVTLASTSLSICTVAGFVITAVAPGTCSITASQAGNINYEAAADVIRTFSITGVINIAAIAGVTAPVTGATPVSTTTAGTGYTGVVSWSGSPTTFEVATTYTATITLTAASGYTLTGVSANFFSVAGATTVTHAADSGVITVVFPATAPRIISAPAIAGVTAPVKDATPVSTTTAGTGYTGVVSWSGSPTTFGAATTYTATITLTAASGYTLTGVSANFFSVAGATTVTHAADSGVITAVFPATESRVYAIGETGPGGGTIFYVASTPFACGPARAAICKYLEAAPANWSGGGDPTRAWANTTYQSTAVNNGSSPQTAKAIEIGWGYSNTRAIILQGNTDPNTSAAALADAYTATVSSVVYDDWYLPSKYELNEMCKWARGVAGTPVTTLCTGGLANAGVMFNGATINPGFQSAKAYWSSTEVGANTAGYIYFPHASQAESNKGNGNTEHVRPIRAFY